MIYRTGLVATRTADENEIENSGCRDVFEIWAAQRLALKFDLYSEARNECERSVQ